MFQTAVLASGSKGNCVLVRTEKTKLLVDAGISGKRIWAAMDSLQLKKEKLNGILITHEHGDHILGVGAVSRTLKIPVYITRDTYEACKHRLGKLFDRIEFISAGKTFFIHDLIIHPLQSSHDAIDSVNFTFEQQGTADLKLAVATDLGFQTMLLIKHLKGCSTIVLESNHDEQMLREGRYEWHLKQRILSNQGHLSNVQAVGVISQIMHPGLRNLILAHLSEINNHPDIAQETMRKYLAAINAGTRLIIADQFLHTPLIEV